MSKFTEFWKRSEEDETFYITKKGIEGLNKALESLKQEGDSVGVTIKSGEGKINLNFILE